MLLYISFIVLVNAGFYWLINSLRNRLRITRRTANIVVVIAFSESILFPLALNYLQTYQALLAILSSTLAISVYVGLKGEDMVTENFSITQEGSYIEEQRDEETILHSEIQDSYTEQVSTEEPILSSDYVTKSEKCEVDNEALADEPFNEANRQDPVENDSNKVDLEVPAEMLPIDVQSAETDEQDQQGLKITINKVDVIQGIDIIADAEVIEVVENKEITEDIEEVIETESGEIGETEELKKTEDIKETEMESESEIELEVTENLPETEVEEIEKNTGIVELERQESFNSDLIKEKDEKICEEEGKEGEDVVILMEESNASNPEDDGVIDFTYGNNIEETALSVEDEVAAGVEQDFIFSEDNLNDLIEQGFAAKIHGDKALAIRLFDKALRYADSSELLFMLSVDIFSMYKELGQINEAKAFLNKFIQGHSSSLSDQMNQDLNENMRAIED